MKRADLKSLTPDDEVIKAKIQGHDLDHQDTDKQEVLANSQRVEKDSFDFLQAALLDLGLPATIDRTAKPRSHLRDEVTVVVLSTRVEGLAAFFEGNRQYPGAFLFAFTPLWLSRRPSPSDVTMETLYAHKAVTADAGGQTFLDIFTPPRRVTYIVNHLTDDYEEDILQAVGAELTSTGLDTPMSGTLAISRRVNDMLMTHILCADIGLAHPVTLAFWLPEGSGHNYPDNYPTIRVVRLGTEDMDVTEVESNIRQFVASQPMQIYQKIVAGIYPSDSPAHGKPSMVLSLELFLRKWGIRDTAEQKKIRDSIKNVSERVMTELMEREGRLTIQERGSVGAQLDIIGLNMILETKNGVITPVVVDMKGQDCVELCFAHERTHPGVRGEEVCCWVQTMVARSQRFLLYNKRVLMIGAGGFSERHLWGGAKDYGVKVVLVDSNPDHFAKDQVYRFLHMNFEDHLRDNENVDVIANLVTSEIGQVDGCFTTYENCIPLASLVAEGLGLPHTPSYRAAMTAKSKHLTQKVLLEDTRELVHSIPVCQYASPIVRITGAQDLDNAFKKITLPAVLKIEFGICSVGTRHVNTHEEVAEHVQLIREILLPEKGMRHGDSMVLMPRLVGTEHDVEIVMFEGKVMAAFVVDMGPTPFPLCQQMMVVMPSVLCDESQHKLIAASAACCRSMGLVTGVFAVGMMFTSLGPKVIEINARMGITYTREYIRLMYDVDLFHLALMAACGVSPVCNTNSLISGYSTDRLRENKGQLIALQLYPGRHGDALATTATPEHLKSLHDKGIINFYQLAETLDKCSHEYELPYAILGVRGSTVEDTRAKFIPTCLSLGLETEESIAELVRDVIVL